MTNTEVKRPSVVVLGGGYGGLNTAKALDDVADVTLVDPSDAFHTTSRRGVRSSSRPGSTESSCRSTGSCTSGRFVRDRAVAVDGRKVTLESGAELSSPTTSCWRPARVPVPGQGRRRRTSRAPRTGCRPRTTRCSAPTRALIVGAGPSGLELAGEIKAFFPDKDVTVVDVNPDILTGPFEQDLREELKRQLDKLGVELVLGSPLTALPDAPAGHRDAGRGDHRERRGGRGRHLVPRLRRPPGDRLPARRPGRGPRRARLPDGRREPAGQGRRRGVRPRRHLHRRPRHRRRRHPPGRCGRRQHPVRHHRRGRAGGVRGGSGR